MQPVAALDSLEVPTSAAPASSTEAPQAPGSTAFAALAEADVAAEDVFFHRYFTMDRVRQRRAAAARTRALKRKAKKKAGSGSEDESDEEDVEGGDDGSAAEEDFLDDLEQLPVCSPACCVMFVFCVAKKIRLSFGYLCVSCMRGMGTFSFLNDVW